MKNTLKDMQTLKELGMPMEMLTLYQRCCDTNDKRSQERLLRRFCGTKKQALAEDRKKLFCLDYLMARIENM